MTTHYQDDKVTLYHGDCLDVMRELPDASVDAVVTDPPYNLSTSAKRDKKCLREVVSEILLPRDEHDDTERGECVHLATPALRGADLRGEDWAVRVDAGVGVPEGAVHFEHPTVVQDEVGAGNEPAALATDGDLPLEGDSLSFEFGGDLILQSADGWDATFCNGTCRCFTESSTGFIAVSVIVPRLACGNRSGVRLAVEGRDANVGVRHDAGRQAEGPTGVHAGRGAEDRAVLRLDLRGGTGELDLTDRTLDNLTPFQLARAEGVGAGAGAGRLSPVAQPYRVRVVDGTAGRAFTLHHVAHILNSSTGGFMGKEWDGWENPAAFQRWCTAWTAECLRVLKPGGHLLAFGGTRTWHRLAVAVEDAGFEVRDSVAWIYGSGFPKSLNASRATKESGHACTCPEPSTEHDVRPLRNSDVPQAEGSPRGSGSVLLPSVPEPSASTGGAKALAGQARGGEPRMEGRGDLQAAEGQLRGAALREVPGGLALHGEGGRLRDGAPASDGALDRATVGADGSGEPHQPRPTGQPTGEPGAVPEQRGPQAWRGWAVCAGCGKPSIPDGLGTALKPAFEPIVVGRKPLTRTVAANVLEHGTGALNIDGCRVGSGERPVMVRTATEVAASSMSGKSTGATSNGETTTLGRWPTNVVLDDTQAVVLDEMSGEMPGGNMPAKRNGIGYMAGGTGTEGEAVKLDGGGASRFFPTFRYEAKAPASERPFYYRPTCECEDAWPTHTPSAARAIDGTTAPESSSTSKSGSATTGDPSPTATRSTTSTATSSTTTPTTSSPSPRPTTSASTPDANSETAAGGSRAAFAASSSPSAPVTGTSAVRGGRSMDDAARATSQGWSATSVCGECGAPTRREAHATVKPLDLMRWLVRLVTPPGGTVLEPFAGSGTTVEAALVEGFQCIAIEKTDEYLPLVMARIHRRRDPIAAIKLNHGDLGLFDLDGEAS